MSIILCMEPKGDILIAEDDAVLREVYTKKFSFSGYEIRTTVDGAETIKEIEKRPPDLLILDINMPTVNGFAVMEKYPKESRGFPIIILTNLGDEETEKRGKELGMDGFLVKNKMTIKTLIEMVDKLIEQKR